MSWFSDVMGNILKAHELYATVNLQLEHIQKDIEKLSQEVTVLRRDVNDLSHRVVRLEESRNSIDAQVEAKVSSAISQAVADLKVDYAQTKAELIVKFAHAQASKGALERPELPPPTRE